MFPVSLFVYLDWPAALNTVTIKSMTVLSCQHSVIQCNYVYGQFNLCIWNYFNSVCKEFSSLKIFSCKMNEIIFLFYTLL